MQDKHNRQGGALTIVIAIMVLLAIGVAVFFAFSEPYRQQVKDGWEQHTQWTAERIQENPDGYLRWAIDEVEDTEASLNATRLRLKTRQLELQTRLEAWEPQLANLEQVLTEAKTAYREADSGEGWSAEVRGTAFTEAELKREVVSTHREVQNLRMKVKQAQQASNAMDERLGAIDDKLAEVGALKTKLQSDLSAAELAEGAEGIDALTARIDAISATTDAMSDADDKPSLSELAEPTGERKLEADFSAIMEQNGE